MSRNATKTIAAAAARTETAAQRRAGERAMLAQFNAFAAADESQQLVEAVLALGGYMPPSGRSKKLGKLLARLYRIDRSAHNALAEAWAAGQ